MDLKFLVGTALLGLASPSAASRLDDAFSAKPAVLAPASLSPLLKPIVIDAGHGGDDLGAVVGGRREKDIALAIARKLKNRLTAPAVLTREADVYVPLDQRISKSLSSNGSLFVSLHLNQVRRRNQQGIVVYAFGKSPFRLPKRLFGPRKVPPLPAPPRAEIEESGRLARAVARSLSASGFKVEPLGRADYYVLKNPKIPSILVELGYLSNPSEAARLSDPAYQDRLVDALARSLTDYLAAATLPRVPREIALAVNRPLK